MTHGFDVENTEALRRRAGIDDVELRECVRNLAVGDRVNLTLLASGAASTGETVTVRITKIAERAYWGCLVEQPASRGFGHIHAGLPIAFAAAHIHSVLKRQHAQG